MFSLTSTTTTNILLIGGYVIAAIKIFGSHYLEKKGSNRADIEDASKLEVEKKVATQPFDIELAKISARNSFILDQYKEVLKIRMDFKKILYQHLTNLKLYTRERVRATTQEGAQEAWNKYEAECGKVADFLSVNKHFAQEIDDQLVSNFESIVNKYHDSCRAASAPMLQQVELERLHQAICSVGEEFLDMIDVILAKIYYINPAEIPK